MSTRDHLGAVRVNIKMSSRLMISVLLLQSICHQDPVIVPIGYNETRRRGSAANETPRSEFNTKRVRIRVRVRYPWESLCLFNPASGPNTSSSSFRVGGFNLKPASYEEVSIE